MKTKMVLVVTIVQNRFKSKYKIVFFFLYFISIKCSFDSKQKHPVATTQSAKTDKIYL